MEAVDTLLDGFDSGDAGPWEPAGLRPSPQWVAVRTAAARAVEVSELRGPC